MEAVAAAFGRDLVANDQAADWLAERGYSADDLVAETTHLPADCRPLANEAGVAPGAVVESVYVLPVFRRRWRRCSFGRRRGVRRDP